MSKFLLQNSTSSKSQTNSAGSQITYSLVLKLLGVETHIYVFFVPQKHFKCFGTQYQHM